MNTLANRLIEMNKNFGEAMELTDRAMALARNKYDYFNYSDTKGHGLYNQGKYAEALDILQGREKNHCQPSGLTWLISHQLWVLLQI